MTRQADAVADPAPARTSALPPWLAPVSAMRLAFLGSPGQPRDDDGRWTDGPGGSGVDAGSKRLAEKRSGGDEKSTTKAAVTNEVVAHLEKLPPGQREEALWEAYEAASEYQDIAYHRHIWPKFNKDFADDGEPTKSWHEFLEWSEEYNGPIPPPSRDEIEGQLSDGAVPVFRAMTKLPARSHYHGAHLQSVLDKASERIEHRANDGSSELNSLARLATERSERPAPIARRRAGIDRSHIGPAVSAQLYIDRVVQRGLEASPGAVRETLAAVMAAVEGARSYGEVQERLVALAPGAVERSKDFAAIVEGAVLLGIGAGAWTVGEEVA